MGKRKKKTTRNTQPKPSKKTPIPAPTMEEQVRKLWSQGITDSKTMAGKLHTKGWTSNAIDTYISENIEELNQYRNNILDAEKTAEQQRIEKLKEEVKLEREELQKPLSDDHADVKASREQYAAEIKQQQLEAQQAREYQQAEAAMYQAAPDGSAKADAYMLRQQRKAANAADKTMQHLNKAKMEYQNLASSYIDSSIERFGNTREAYEEAARNIGLGDIDLSKVNKKDWRGHIDSLIDDRAQDLNALDRKGLVKLRRQMRNLISEPGREFNNVHTFAGMNISMDKEIYGKKLRAWQQRTESTLTDIGKVTDTALQKTNAAAVRAGKAAEREAMQVASKGLGKLGRAGIFAMAGLATTAVAAMMFAGGKRENAQLYNPNAAFQYA